MEEQQERNLDQLVTTCESVQRNVKSTEGVLAEAYDRVQSWSRLPVATLDDNSTNDIVFNNTQRLVRALLLNLPKDTMYPIAASVASELKDTAPPYNRLISQEEISQKCSLQANINITEAADVAALTTGTAESDLYNKIFQGQNSRKVAFWGPSFAVLILRLEKRQPATVSTKLSKLHTNLSNLYGTTVGCPDLTYEWDQYLKPYSGLLCPEVQKNTVVIGFICAYSRTGITQNTKGLLDFLLLQSLRYTGMLLITLSDQVRLAYGCPLSVLIKLTYTTASSTSWNAMMTVLKDYMLKSESVPENEPDREAKIARLSDESWYYIREFVPGCFADLAYPKNKFLCTLLAIILDYHSSDSYTETNMGPITSGLMIIRGQETGNADYYNRGYAVASYLRRNYIMRAVGLMSKEMEAAAEARRATP